MDEQQYVMSIGDMLRGFTMHGPFDSESEAWQYAQLNWGITEAVSVLPLFMIVPDERDGFV